MNNILKECIDKTIEEIEQDNIDFYNQVLSEIKFSERELEKLQTARYQDSNRYPYTDEQYDVLIAHFQHMLESSRLMSLEYHSKSNAFSIRLCERLMKNAISHRDIVEQMMEVGLINENVYNEQSKKLMNFYSDVKEKYDEYRLI